MSVFMLILVICLAGIGIVTVQVKNMDKINQNIGNEYLNSIQEVNTLSVNEAYLENDLKDYMLKEDKDSIRSDITSAQEMCYLLCKHWKIMQSVKDKKKRYSV